MDNPLLTGLTGYPSDMLSYEQLKYLEGQGWPCYLATRGEEGRANIFLCGPDRGRKVFHGMSATEAYASAVLWLAGQPAPTTGTGVIEQWRVARAHNATVRRTDTLELTSPPPPEEMPEIEEPEEEEDPLGGL